MSTLGRSSALSLYRAGVDASGAQYEIRWGSSRAVAVEVGGGVRLYDDVLLGYEADELARRAGAGARAVAEPARGRHVLVRRLARTSCR